jgi:hypothetical protein
MSRLFPPSNQQKTINAASTNLVPNSVDVHLFDGGGGYHCCKGIPKVRAEGAYLKIGNAWYINMRGNLTPINYSDIPADVKATMLLLQLDI